VTDFRPITLLPWHIVRICPKCGYRRYRVPVWVMRLFDLRITSFKVSYCAGSRDPQTIEPIMALGADGPTIGHIETTVPCADLRQEHLHVHCSECHYTQYMRTKRGTP
jgi:hypothetical protein